MGSQGFSFPPPPPPPPTAQQPPAYPPTQHGQNWGRGGGQRGRGRGQGNRGRGGNHPDGGRPPSYPPPTGYNYSQPNYTGYPTQPVATAPYIPPSPYAHGQSQGYQNPQSASAFPNTQFPQPVASASYQHLPYNPAANHAPYPPTPTYMQGLPAPPHSHQPNNQAMIGAMPWSNEMQGQFMGVQPGQRGPRPHAHGNHGPKPKMNQKRDHSSAFTKPQSTVPRTPAAPAVPSFGNPLPSKPPPAADASSNRKAKKRKRKHNQLGLTPHADDHESSEDEEEEGEDEESKLAQAGSGAAPLQISYKGKTSTLQTQSEIAAWIAERKKNFPTQARIEAKQKATEEAKAVREAARQQKMQEQQAKRKDSRKQSENTTNPPDAGTDAQRREELRRNLEREQKRIAKAVAEADAARLRLEALQKEALSLNTESQQEDTPVITEEPIKENQDPVLEKTEPAIKPDPAVIEPHDTISESEPGVPASHATEPESISAGITPKIQIQDPTHHGVDGQMELSNHEDSDWTSSGGSDSDPESDSDSDSAPEQGSSRRTGLERVPPPPREGKKTICRYFARTGQCNRGDQCKFVHEISEQKAKPERKKEKERRKGLYQALLDRQKEDEDRRTMELISYLGQNNML